MLDLLISILMAFGFVYDPSSGKIQVNQDVVCKVQASPNYKDFGGDAALYDLVNVTPKTNDDIVVGVPVDPTPVE